MNPERQAFLNMRHIPARLTAEEAGFYLGFGAHDIPILMGSGTLRPLGTPATNGCKYFARCELDTLAQSKTWMAQASDAIMRFWQAKNHKKLQATSRKKRKAGRAMAV